MRSESDASPPDMGPTTRADRSGKLLVSAFVAFAAAAIAYFAFGMPGMDHGSGSSMDDMDMSSGLSTHRLVDPTEFADEINQPDSAVINVHVPYDGEIEGTDLFMPFDQIDPLALPADRDTPLVVYCRSGSMSAKAVVTLAGLGYTNITELKDGMNAWRASGRPVHMRSTGG